MIIETIQNCSLNSIYFLINILIISKHSKGSILFIVFVVPCWLHKRSYNQLQLVKGKGNQLVQDNHWSHSLSKFDLSF